MADDALPLILVSGLVVFLSCVCSSVIVAGWWGGAYTVPGLPPPGTTQQPM